MNKNNLLLDTAIEIRNNSFNYKFNSKEGKEELNNLVACVENEDYDNASDLVKCLYLSIRHMVKENLTPEGWSYDQAGYIDGIKDAYLYFYNIYTHQNFQIHIYHGVTTPCYCDSRIKQDCMDANSIYEAIVKHDHDQLLYLLAHNENIIENHMFDPLKIIDERYDFSMLKKYKSSYFTDGN